MKKYFILSIIIFLTLSAALYSQSAPSCIIIHAEGDGFTHVRGEDDKYYDLFETDVLGMVFRQGDILITEPGTVLELQVAGSNNIVKISENSSFRLDSFEEKGGGLFSLSYGRIRAKVEKITGNQSFRIDGKSAVCGVRGTDFGYDILSDPSGLKEDLMTRIYCFTGSVEVQKKPEAAPESIEGLPDPAVVPDASPAASLNEAIIISANEMVAIKTSEPEKKLVSETLSEDVIAFWDINNFKSEPLSVITMQDIRFSLDKKEYREEYKLFWGSMGLVFTGIALEMVTFFAGQLGGENTFSSGSSYFPVAVSGGILIGSGIAGLTAAGIRY